MNKNNKHTRTQGIILILTRETFLRNLMRTPHAALPELYYKKVITISKKNKTKEI